MAEVLVVDDWPINRDFLGTLLQYAGHSVRLAGDGAEALEIMRRSRPDVVITDILMPVMNGVEFAKRVAQDPAFAGIPVIFYTATYRLSEARELASTCGVTTILPKPSDPQQVIDAVHGELGLPLVALAPPPASAGEPAPLPAPQQPPTREIQVRYEQELGRLRREIQASVESLDAPLNGEAKRLSHIASRVEQSFLNAQALAMRLATVIELDLDLAGRESPGEILAVFCRAARDVLSAKVAVAGILDEAGHVHEFAALGLSAEQSDALRAQLKHVGGTLAEVFRDGRVRNLERAVDPLELGFPANHPPVTNLLAARIATRNRAYGWFYVASRSTTASDTNGDPQLAEILAAQLGTTYENLLLLDRIRRHAGVLELEIEQRQKAMERLRESELRFRQLAENISEVFFLIDAKTSAQLYVSPAYSRIWQRSVESAYSPGAWLEGVHPDDRPRVVDQYRNPTGTGEFTQEFRVVRPDGTLRWLRARGFPIRDSSGSVYRIAGLAEDITDSKLQELSIRRLSRMLRVLSDINSAIVRIHDRAELLDETCRILHDEGGFPIAWIGLVAKDGLLGIRASRGLDATAVAGADVHLSRAHRDGPLAECLRSREIVARAGEGYADTRNPVAQVAQQAGCRSFAYLPLSPNDKLGGVIAIYSTETDPFDESEMGLLKELAGDVAFALQYIAGEERLNYLAYYDPLTDLPNNALFRDRIAQMLERMPQRAALFLADLDRFTHLNDSLGRHVGDRLLAGVAQRLREAVPEPTYLGRVGPDTFAVAVSSLKSDTEAAAILRERVLAPLNRPFELEGREVRVSARSGVAVYPEDGRTADTLYQNAEAALMGARESGARYLFYSPQMNSRVAEDLALEQQLRVAFEQGQFALFYQPKIDAANDDVVGVEALLRWRSPNGIVPPDRFIRVLEQSELIVDVGRWVVQQALEDYKTWEAHGLRAPPIAVNVSPIQLRYGDFPDMLLAELKAAGIPSAPLEIEITESVLMADMDANTEGLRRLGDAGVKVAMDDFGTGYSSLRYLAKLPVDTLKIDRSFIVAMLTDPDSMTLVSTMISLAHAFELSVVAEGVDAEEQARLLRLMKCDVLQGYLFSRPVPAEQIEPLLQRRDPA